MKDLMTIKYYLERLSEPSTWTAIVILLGMIGYKLDGTFQAGVWMERAGAAVILINIFWKKDSQSKRS